MRSAKPPTMSAGVMMAKVIWNMKYTVSGMCPLALTLSLVTPLMNHFSKPINPFIAPPSPKARP